MNNAKRLRRSPEGGYARGNETRRRILEAAIFLFGEHGFSGTSTRDIATQAGVNAPALQYYFENKEGVYRACLEALTDDAWKTVGPSLEHAREAVREKADAAPLIDAFIRIQEAILDSAFANADGPGLRLFFAREDHGRDSATQILSCRIRELLYDVSAALVAQISGHAADDPVTLIRGLSLLGQLLVFHVAHRSTLPMLGHQRINPEGVHQVKTIVCEQTRMLLEQWTGNVTKCAHPCHPIDRLNFQTTKPRALNLP